MKLKLVKQGDFLGTKCDFYVNEKGEIFMSRTQIGYALKYKNPSKGIENLHNRHYKRMDNLSVVIRGSQIEGGSKHIDPKTDMYMYTERGIYGICRYSNQMIDDDFNDWVYDTILSIKKNGYYIATEKDNKWLGIREESKLVRKAETDVIKEYVEYAKSQGSKNAERYYTIFTKLVNSKIGIESNQRDNISQQALMEMKTLEGLINMRIRSLIKEKKPYKMIYQEIKNLIESI